MCFPKINSNYYRYKHATRRRQRARELISRVAKKQEEKAQDNSLKRNTGSGKGQGGGIGRMDGSGGGK